MVSQRVILKVEKLSKYFGRFPALSNVSLEFAKGEVVAIMGPSGAGKTIFLRCIAGLEPVSEGRIKYFPNGGDEEVVINGFESNPGLAFGKISMVFQNLQLWPHMTVFENLMYAPIHAKNLSNVEAEKKVKMIAKQLDIIDQLAKYPRELSIGQQQRVAIARTLAVDPEIILLDEITSALDPERTQDITKVIETLAKTEVTLFIVTHHVSLAKELAQKFVFIFEGEVAAICSSLEQEILLKLPEAIKRFINASKLGG